MVFISYAWKKNSNKSYNENVLKLASKLRTLGYDANVDVMEMNNHPSVSFSKMMADNLRKADKVIVVLSAEYKKKADSFCGGVGQEYQYIINDMASNQDKYILCAIGEVNDEMRDSITPDFLRGRRILSIPEDMAIENNELVFLLAGVPRVKMPEVSSERFIPSQIDFSGENEEITDDFFEYQMKNGKSTMVYSTVFFDERIRKAFPGVRGLEIYDEPRIAVNCLSVLLKTPFDGFSVDSDPIWFFRGICDLQIERFSKLSDTKCLMGTDELDIKRVAAFIHPGSQYYRDFVYVEVNPETPVGIYSYEKGFLEGKIEQKEYYFEEYGLFNGIPVTRNEYDDGAAIIGGEHVDIEPKCELRVRYLTPYNFIICGKFSPYADCDEIEMERILDDILFNEGSIDSIVQFGSKLKRNRHDQAYD